MVLYEDLKEVYEAIGYKVLITSLLESSSDSLVPIFEGKKSLVSGHSGSGKSTLINKLIPEAKQEVNDVSSFANKGVHTTTFAEMFELNERTSIIDTPGFKELALSEIAPEELSHYFPEMRELLGQCKFHNCLHLNEPGCCVKANVGHKVSKLRYDSYLSILQNEDNRK